MQQSIFFVLLMVANISWAGIEVACYVSGDTSGADASKPLGSAQNPYGSLAGVEADLSCEKIIVLWSSTTLDGGISLAPGQKLEGERGPNGELPVITNSSAARLGGRGVWLSSDNVIRHLHVKDAWRFGVGGFFVGKLAIEKSRVTGSGQIGTPVGNVLFPNGAWPNVYVFPISDADITIRHSEFGESNGASLTVFPLAGHSQVRIHKVHVSDQWGLTDDKFDRTPGIWISTSNNAFADVKVRNSSVRNIGRGNSNSDGLALLNLGSGDFVAEVDGYSYLNPDGDGGNSATGMELGIAHGAGGSFTGRVTNSFIDGATSCGIQVIDVATAVGGNRLEAAVQDNVLVGNSVGICGWQDETPFSDYSLVLEDNEIYDSTFHGAFLQVYGPISTFDVFMEGNTIADSGQIGVIAQRFENFTGSINVDAGLGVLGSEGHNRIIGSGLYDVFSWGMDVTAANNWWGSATGPSSVLALNGAIVVVDPFLTVDPD